MKFKFLTLLFALIGNVCLCQNWLPVGNGSNWQLNTIYVDSAESILYVGGNFSQIGEISTHGIARLINNVWDSVGGGINQHVVAITRFKESIIVGGAFDSAGDVLSPNLAKWKDNQWYPFGNPNGSVQELFVLNDEMYVGGSFDSIGNINANGIAKWDGSTWSAVGNFKNYFSLPEKNIIGKISFYKGDLYVAGIINDSLGHKVDYCYWNGQQWTYVDILSGSFSSCFPGSVYHDNLYLLGLFLQSEGNIGNCILRFDGSSWEDVAGGITGALYPQLTNSKVNNNKLYVTGIFDYAGGIPASNIAIWNDVEWCSLPGEINNKIMDLDFFNDTLYIVGGFTGIDNVEAKNIAKWTGGNLVDSCSGPVSVPELSDFNEFNIFPNPAQNLIYITSSSYIEDIEIIDFTGRDIAKNLNLNSFEQNNIHVDITILPSGIYILKIWMNGKTYLKKLVKY